MSYQDDLKKHLAEFKRRDLGISESGVFRYRGRDVLREHILPLANASANLLEKAEPAVGAFLAAYPHKRHRYFHHLNSSQAFAFNLFFPYFSGKPESASALLRALGQEQVLATWEPEAIPEVDEETNIDVLWATTDGVRTFCEVKLSEGDFGKAADDDRHRAKLVDIYCEVLTDHLAPARLERLAFFDAYQFNRNAWHMVRADHSRLIFLLPRANTGLWRLLQGLLSGVVPGTRKRIFAIAIEDVIANLSTDSLCPEKLREYARRLRQKYLIQPVTWAGHQFLNPKKFDNRLRRDPGNIESCIRASKWKRMLGPGSLMFDLSGFIKTKLNLIRNLRVLVVSHRRMFRCHGPECSCEGERA